MDAKIEENIQQHRFELLVADEMLAAIYYRVENGQVVLLHTEVPSEFSGRGLGSQVAHGTFALLRKTGRRATLKCPFLARFFIKNPEYADIVAG